MSPVSYELGFYIPEDDILHSHFRENLKSYMERLLFAFLRKVRLESQNECYRSALVALVAGVCFTSRISVDRSYG
jgi:hypothetical protein